MTRSPSRPRQRGQVLIMIFLGTLLLGVSAGGMDSVFSERSIKALRKEMKSAVPDAARREKLEPLISSMDTEIRRFSSEHAHMGGELLALMARHDATPADFDRLLAQVDTLNTQSRNILLDLRFRMRAELSAQEWERLFDAIHAHH
jgi:hypothetical protein